MPAQEFLPQNLTEGNTILNNSLDNNAANIIHQDDLIVMEPFVVTVMRLSLFGVVFLTAVVGNVIVFTAPWRNPNLRTFSYYLITTLAISDFISVLGMPLIVASGELGSWIFGEVLCRGLNPTQVICSMVTISVHTTIAIDRYRAVRNPFRVKPTGGQTALVIALILLFSLFCALPAFGARKLISYSVPGGKVYHACFEHFPVKPVFFRQLYTVFLFLLNYLFPFIIMFCLYTRVVITLRNSEIRKQRSLLRKQNVSSRKVSVTSKKQIGAASSETSFSSWTRKKSVASRKQSTSSTTESQPTTSFSRRHTALEKKFIKMIFLVLGIFILCYLPYQIFFLLVDFAPELIENWSYKFIAHNVVFFITWLPNAINPICYNAMDRYYKRAFKIMFKLCRKARRRNAYDRNADDMFSTTPSQPESIGTSRR